MPYLHTTNTDSSVKKKKQNWKVCNKETANDRSALRTLELIIFQEQHALDCFIPLIPRHYADY